MNHDLRQRLINKLKQPGFEKHAFSMDRRNLIQLGLIAGGGAVVPLSFMQRALAQLTQAPTIPFLVFDIAGGIAMPGNFLVGKQGGPEDLFADYAPHGWNPRAAGAIDKTFGLPMAKAASQLLAGLKQTLPPAIANDEKQRMLKMASFCHFSIDDTTTNQSSAITLISKAGLRGRFIRGGIGEVASNSGGNSDVYLNDARFRPKAVSSAEDLLSLTSFGDNFEQLPPNLRKEIFSRLQDSAGGDSQLRDLYSQVGELGIVMPQMKLSNSKEVEAIYSSQPSTLEGTIVYNVLMGYTGPGVITIPDCDYHNKGQAAADAKDLLIGQAIGRAINAAYTLKKPLFIQIITDGGVYTKSTTFERSWDGDANQHSLSVLAYFDPLKPVELRKPQVGHYAASGQVETATLVGPKPEKMVLGTLLNYLNLSGNTSLFESVASARLQNNEIDELLVFG